MADAASGLAASTAVQQCLTVVQLLETLPRVTRYRMKQLTELTGVSRQVVHFYIKKGLVPPPIRRSRTSAEYTDEHVARIREIRRMREEQFLPLDAIRAAIDSRDDGYSPSQRVLIAAVRRRFGGAIRRPGQRATVAVATAARRTGVPAAEIRDLVASGLIEHVEDTPGRPRISREDLWLVELWAELSAIGFGTADGFRPTDVRIYQRAVDELVRSEVELITARLAMRPPEQLAQQIERALPLMTALLGQLHDRAVRRFLATRAADSDGPRDIVK